MQITLDIHGPMVDISNMAITTLTKHLKSIAQDCILYANNNACMDDRIIKLKDYKIKITAKTMKDAITEVTYDRKNNDNL